MKNRCAPARRPAGRASALAKIHGRPRFGKIPPHGPSSAIAEPASDHVQPAPFAEPILHLTAHSRKPHGRALGRRGRHEHARARAWPGSPCATPMSSCTARWRPAKPPSCATRCGRWVCAAASRARPTRWWSPERGAGRPCWHFDFYRFNDRSGKTRLSRHLCEPRPCLKPNGPEKAGGVRA